ncbi:MAG TPA: DUF3783 domain-containing protein [Candidatus Mediterraneibacter faecigallinarum]|jgi:hypothetical protein|uniref:DUF3783 domain-containing protein n=1 Tax=Candidatus Mediterraneibacter faecigallinarum TaxID=2838669 RepID=A0A9D2SZ12_9FIRM|nr:DUF3783 domain-containing protein [Candidatus Mediterraneibacter faecigallinarum]
MKETILLFNPPEKEKLLKIEMALFPLHVRLKKISPEQYNQPLGVLAGIKDMTPVEGVYSGGELPGTLFVFCFLEGNRLDQALAALRRCGAGPFPYKAVLTPTNSRWTAPDCFEEIRREHEAMHPE